MERSSSYILYVVSNNGDKLAAINLEAELAPIYFHASLLDESRLFYRGICYNFCTGEKEWKLLSVASTENVGQLCPLSCGKFAVAYNASLDDGKGHIFLHTFGLDGKTQAYRSFAGNSAWDTPVLWREKLLFCYCDSDWQAHLVCFDTALSENWHIDLPIGDYSLYLDSQPILDYSTDVVYIQGYIPGAYSRLIAVDLSGQKILAVKDLEKSDLPGLASVLAAKGPIIQQSGSTFEVLNQELCTISRHRVRGDICEYIPQDGSLGILSYVPEFCGDMFVSASTKPGCLRLYNLKSTS